MSKLKDALKKARQSEGGRALGFTPAAGKNHRGILVGIYTGPDFAAAKTGLGAGANFAVIHTDNGATAATAIAAAEAGDAFLGAHVGTLAEGDGEKLAEAGCAFVVVDPDKALAAEAAHEGFGIVIPVDLAAEHRDLQTLSRLDLEAVVVPEEIGDISLTRQASLRRAATLTGQRLFVKVAVTVTESELEILRDSGVGALLIPDSAPADAIEELIARIESLKPRKPEDDGRHISLGSQQTSET